MMKRAKRSDESGKKLIAKINREMDLPRLTESVRNPGKSEATPASKSSNASS